MKTNETFRKTTAGGKMLVCALVDGSPVATVDGKLVMTGVVLYEAPKTVKGKTVVASLGGVGLTADELDAVKAGGWQVGEPPPVTAPRSRRGIARLSAR